MPVTPQDRLRSSSKAMAARLNARHKAEVKTVTLARERSPRLAGSVTAILGHTGVVDRDGDILDPGSMRPAPVVIVSPWDHESLPRGGRTVVPPVGTARVWEAGGKIMAEVTLHDTPEGRSTCEKITSARPDWSFGLMEIETRPLTSSERARGARRAIVRFTLNEVSPVTKGASIAQGTTSACCGSCALAASGKAHVPCDEPPAPDEIVPSQRMLAKRIQADTQRIQVSALVDRIRESLARIEGDI